MKNSLEFRVKCCWNAGLTLSQAYKRVAERYGFTDKQAVIAIWRDLKRRYRCASLPHSEIYGYTPKPRDEREVQRELNTWVCPLAGTYGNWKGITGPGKQLREMLAAERQK